MKYLSLFSGIEAATVAWQQLGWQCVAVSEIDPFANAVLAHHYPNTPNLGDITQIKEDDIKALGHIDLVVFGSPCQDLSVAGKRRGLVGHNSGLFYDAINIINWAKQHCGCRFALWENVPGVFSSNKGKDFAAVVAAMAGLQDVDVPKYGWGKEGVAIGDEGLLEWSVLDAQWFGLAQRRKRVFAIVDFADWASRPPILLERKSLRGDTPPSRDKRQNIATSTTARLASGGQVAGTILANCGDKQWLGNQEAFSGEFHIIHGSQDPIVNTTTANALGRNNGLENIICYCGTPNDAMRDLSTNLCPTLRAGQGSVIPAIAIAGNIIGRREGNGGNGKGYDDTGVSYTLTSTDRHAVCVPPLTVRKLTPIECERLQGFPDNYTRIPYRNKSVKYCPNGHRYKALGNSMAVPVMLWIGKQIQAAIDYSKST